MQRLSIPALLVISLALPLTSFANAELKAFKDAKGKLDADIQSFVKQVAACNPPLIKDRIVDGFGGMKADSAVSLLKVLDANVASRVAEAQCSAALSGLEEDLKNYRAGNTVAKNNETLMRHALTRGTGDKEKCAEAVKTLDALKGSDQSMLASLEAMKAAFSRKCRTADASRRPAVVSEESDQREYRVSDIPAAAVASENAEAAL